MKCPYCSHEDTKVIDSRTMDDHNAIRRRRLCEHCEGRFTTYERIDLVPPSVIKRNGYRESFSRDKLLNGIIKSCNKRPVSMEQMETIVSDVENIAVSAITKEIDSQTIGELIMEKLKDIDEVAYVRFASVYKQFKDIDTFMQELLTLLHPTSEKLPK